MKIAPYVPLSQRLFQDIGSTRTTWEYRWATNAVIFQFLVGSGVIAWYWKSLPPQVPLWYSKPWGDERLASPWFLFLPLVSSVVIYLVNLTAVVRFADNHPMFARVLLLTSMLISILSGFMVIRIVTLIS